MSEDSGVAAFARGARAALDPLLGSSRALAAALSDLRAMRRHTEEIRESTAEISDNTAALTKLAEHLAAIDEQVRELNAEVRLMRAGVDEVSGKVSSLERTVEPVGTLVDIVPGGRRRARRAAERADSSADT